jgi:rhodanese-related sulfurtransferase
MNQTTRTRGLILITVVLAAVIVLGLFFRKNDDAEYELSTDASLQLLLEEEPFVSLDDAYILLSGEDSSTVFIDLRSPDVFNKGHMENAVNIPIHNLLEPSTLERLQDTTNHFILYANSASEGAGAWALLRQLGYTNIKVLQGTYEGYMNGEPSELVDAAEYEFKAVFDQVATQEKGKVLPVKEKEAPQKVVLPKKKVDEPVLEGCF